ncbi:MAG: ATP-binding protein [Haloarculaceae archaeon]
MAPRVNYSGLVIAGIGFFLTRFTVTLAIYQDPIRFYLAGVVPLALGLGLAAFGVALAVADVETPMVRTTAVWCVVGAGTMLVLVVLTLFGSTTGGAVDLATVRSRAYLSNFLIGGSVGGTLTGLYASRNRNQRAELRQQTNRLEVLHRLLRHEILNSLTAIRGYAALRRSSDRDPRTVVENHTEAIERTVEEVKYLTRDAATNATSVGPVEMETTLDESVATVRDRYPDATVSVESVPEDAVVIANERLAHAFAHLLENGIVHAASDAPEIDVAVTTTPTSVRVAVRDEGPGLPDRQRDLLESGTVRTYDDPGTGFGLNIVRLLVESYRGSIETAVDDDGTTVTVVLARAEADETGLRPNPTGLAGVQPDRSHLVVTLGAAVLAGAVYGLVANLLGGSIGSIGVFYGLQHPVVGWITHEFHSVVFGFAFAGLVSVAPVRYRDRVSALVTIGLGWGLVLWLFAAGVVSPIWLRLLGIPATIPSLSTSLLVTHVAWGVSLGLLTAWGNAHVTPRLRRYLDRA